ncbi:DHH family phosphoesterase [Psychrobium sp. 1_MG-2023]|uniref:DHH family phosphoesterase n=1 Tax=Psychrobium sp. 1_MG-2023 TaxID=3062624 RepID=UPI000C34736D|nr:DHH family phosphoesterase [Psychrobium sp. 1_MG-2023]MDP2562123.1 DHH family phosphoesterase [Psychrobium sp. 1_MG-2023]PKF55722.1 acetyltransferase [Alteromonadales bacterium alter-6D02]
MQYDVFNGDADGIIALLQLQLYNPTNSVKITGVKRDIALLKRVDVKAGDTIRVLDISMEKNLEALNNALVMGADVFYVDHHRTGDIPKSDNLKAYIDLDANTCTSLIISKLLDNEFHLWAITAAYGDNLFAKADEEADKLGLTLQQKQQLKAFGTYINYNSYGNDVSDLHYPPTELFEMLLAYSSPFDVINKVDSVYHKLSTAYDYDMEKSRAAEVLFDSKVAKVILLEDAAWSRRVSGVLGNDLANQSPSKAHAVISYNNEGGYTVSVRAPLLNKQGADIVCSHFKTGGGRTAAAGINHLDRSELSEFIRVLSDYYTS